MKEQDSDFQQIEHAVERQRRFRMVAIVAPAFVAVLILLPVGIIGAEVLRYEYGINPIFLAWIAMVLLGFSGLSILMTYLQTGFKRDAAAKVQAFRYSDEVSKLRQELLALSAERAPDVETIESQLAALQEGLMNLERSAVDLTDEQRALFLDKLKSRLEEDAAASVLENIKTQVEKTEKKAFHVRELEKSFEDSQSRLSQELAALGRRGNLNLALGMITTVAGLVFLGMFVLGSQLPLQDPWQFVTYFVPRLTLVVFIEIFAYFFLRLYKASLSEIKYFQNELTNVEAKFVALRGAVTLGDTNIINEVLSKFAATERNFVLEKGQTTIEMEKVKLEKNTLYDIAKNLSNVLPKKS